MRGLKLSILSKTKERGLSHLLQMRGLKLSGKSVIFILVVASFTDAWIETIVPALGAKIIGVASFTDAWIETYFRSREQYLKTSHLLQMRGLKPIQNQPKKNWKQSHLLQMRGLKQERDYLKPHLFGRIFYRCVD